MAMLFSDPLAFLPSSSSAAAVLPPLFPQWNVTSSTFNNHQHLIGSDGDDASSLDRLHSQVMDSVDLIQSQQQSTATGKTSSSNTRNRSNGRRRIKSQPQQQQQQQEPIAIMDLDHPLNSWLTTKTSEKEQFLGPLATRDGTEFPILPQFTYTALSNGSLIQIPILWTAMSMAMGLELRGDIIRGLPCIKRLNQLFCPTAGNRYPGDPIEKFIDENKALIRRMYGEFQTPAPGGSTSSANANGGNGNSKRSVRHSSPSSHHQQSHFRDSELFIEDLQAEGFDSSVFLAADGDNAASNRTRRQAKTNNNNQPPIKDNKDTSNKSDACESTVEVVTPYWAANSSGKIRAIVNTQHFEQAVHQEVCSKPRTGRCTGDCSCEQKYKWHRLLAYDPDNDCKGIFMDWFLFPSCCVCRCLPLP